MKRQFIFVMGSGKLNKRMFSDLYQDERVIVLSDPMKQLRSKILKMLRRIHLSSKVNKISNLPFKRIWKPSLEEIDWREGVQYYIIFQSPAPIQPSYLIEKKEKYNIKYIIYEIDARQYNERMGIKDWDDAIGFDYIFTYDPVHAEKYNLNFCCSMYSMLMDNRPETIEYDMYLAANGKGRLEKMLDIFEKSEEHGVTSKYRIGEVASQEQKLKEKIIYNQSIDYRDVVVEARRSNCILEILQYDRAGATMRYYEAICYNKKLLTTNKNVVNLPFYNPEYIHIFEKPEGINWNWVKERVPVDYHYDGRFSPTHLIDQIIELEEKKK